VLGRPVAHSLSPVLHRAAYAALGLNWTYDAIDCGVEDLPTVLAERSGWAGFSATMPLKHALLDVAAEVRARAAAIGAANTLLPGPNGWIADNTDAAGVAAALAEHEVQPASVTLLGAGGTAQAALAAVAGIGVRECVALVRDPARASALLATAGRLGIRVHVEQLVVGSAALAADLVIATLPPGAADPLADRSWSADQTVLDVVSGALMLLYQAGEQVRLMTGLEPPLAAMRAALRAAAPDGGL
jgi:shikimate dehydrogenase